MLKFLLNLKRTTKLKNLIFYLFLLSLFSPQTGSADMSCGWSVPFVQDKVFASPYLDINSNFYGFYFDMGLMYTRKEIPSYENLHWLGYFLNSWFYLKVNPMPQMDVKAGFGYALDHAIHVDGSLLYHQLPLYMGIEYQTPQRICIGYHLKYPILSSDGYKTTFINQITVGVKFQ